MLLSGHDQLSNIEVEAELDIIHISHIAGVSRNENYYLKAPCPPHIYIPQVPDECVIQSPPSPSGIWCENESFNEILREIIARGDYVMPVKEWKYEWRRQAQQILPFLYLGPLSAARNIEFLKRERITMLLVIRESMSAQANLLDGTRVAHQLGIESKAVNVNGQTGLIAAFSDAIRVINDNLISIYQQSNGSRIGKILVFCETGNERSAAVVSAYLMSTYGLSLISSIHLIQSQRFCISIDDGLKHLLLSYLDILMAKKKVTNCVQQTNSLNKFKNGIKRTRSEANADQIRFSIEQCNDEERFVDRASFAPFS